MGPHRWLAWRESAYDSPSIRYATRVSTDLGLPNARVSGSNTRGTARLAPRAARTAPQRTPIPAHHNTALLADTAHDSSSGTRAGPRHSSRLDSNHTAPQPVGDNSSDRPQPGLALGRTVAPAPTVHPANIR